MCARHGHDLMGCKSPVPYLERSHLTTLKVLADGKAWGGDEPAERSRSANLRADVQTKSSGAILNSAGWPEGPNHRDVVSKLHQAEPQGESAQHDEARPDHWGMVNAAVVQGRIMFLPGEICQPKCPNGRGGTEPAKVRVNMAEVSRGRKPGERR